MKFRNREISFLIFLFICLADGVTTLTYGQVPRFSYKVAVFSPDETNSDHAIHCIARDQFGFIWGGTNKGIVRYNGYQFDVITNEVLGEGVPSGKVNSLVYSKGELIAGTESGLYVLNTNNYKVRRIPATTSDSTDIIQVLLTEKDNLWWITGRGTLFRKNDKEIVHRFLFRALNVPNLSMVYYERDIWIYREQEGIYRIDGVTLEVKKVYPFTTHNDLVKGLSLYNGMLFFGSGNGVYIYHAALDSFNKNDGFDSGASKIVMLEKGILYSRNGYQFVHGYNGSNGHVNNKIELPVNVPLRIYDLLPQGGHVFAASSIGLIQIQVFPSRFELLYNTLLPDRNSLDVPRGVAEDHENYYLATYNLLVGVNKATGRLDTLVHQPLYIHWILRQSDTLWLSTEGKGLYAYSIKQKSCTNIFTTHEGEQVFLTCMDGWGNDTLILGGYSSLWIFEKSTRRKREVFISKDGKKITDVSYNQIMALDANRCLIATSRGTFLVNRSFDCLHHFIPSEQKDALANNINALATTNDSSLWMGARKGIYIYNFQGELLKTLSTDNGLSGNRIAFLVHHKSSHQVWAGTFTGLSAIDARRKDFTNFFAGDGLPSTEFNHSAFFATSDGHLIMGTNTGYVKINPETIPSSSSPASRILISKVVYGLASGEKQVIQPVYVSDARLNLGKQINYIKVFFTSDALFEQRNLSFQYKVEGVHANWMDMGKEPFIYLDPIKQGTLRIQIKLSNGSGSLGVLEDLLLVEVQEYFYRQSWFYAFVFGLLLLISISYIRVLLNKENALQALRADISSDLHDEVGGYLTALNMNIDFLQKYKGKEGVYIQNIRQLCRKSILALKDGLWSLDARSDNAEQLWDRIKTIAEESFEPLQIDYAFSETGTIDLKAYKFSILEKRNLLLIVKECITNIIKHGAVSTVHFKCVHQHQKLSIIIENKVGLSYGINKAGGLGLQNIKKRMEKINGAATIISNDGQFIVILKLDFLHDPFRNYRR